MNTKVESQTVYDLHLHEITTLNMVYMKLQNI